MVTVKGKKQAKQSKPSKKAQRWLQNLAAYKEAHKNELDNRFVR